MVIQVDDVDVGVLEVKFDTYCFRPLIWEVAKGQFRVHDGISDVGGNPLLETLLEGEVDGVEARDGKILLS